MILVLGMLLFPTIGAALGEDAPSPASVRLTAEAWSGPIGDPGPSDDLRLESPIDRLPPALHPYDDPGPAYGYPDANTWGYTTDAPTMDTWATDPVGAAATGSIPEIVVPMQLGPFANKHYVMDQADYWMDVDFYVNINLWSDGDGVYDPVEPCVPFFEQLIPAPEPDASSDDDSYARWLLRCNGNDDPCPEQPFPLFDVFVQVGPNLEFIRTVYGGEMANCRPGDYESHPFKILPDPNRSWEKPNRFHIPQQAFMPLHNGHELMAPPCAVNIVFRPHDLVLPRYAKDHDKHQDGVWLKVDAVMVELVARPLVISHGWSMDADPPLENVEWQGYLDYHLRLAMRHHFGQDPWDWAWNRPTSGILHNKYDRKQDFRDSAAELADHVDQLKTDLNWWPYEKIWMHGHSMGGLVSRYYIEKLGGNQHVDKLVQSATPNTGSWVAILNTVLRQYAYGQDNNERLGIFLFGQYNCLITLGLLGWNPWWDPMVGAYKYHCDWLGQDMPHGRERMSDFMLLPSSSINPPLLDMNMGYGAKRSAGLLPPYLNVRASWDHLPFDQAVPFASASLNGGIRTRTINSAHEDTPKQMPTAYYYARFFGALDLDNGRPTLCYAPPPPVAPTNPQDAVVDDPNPYDQDSSGWGRYDGWGTPIDEGGTIVEKSDHKITLDRATVARFFVGTVGSAPLVRAPSGATYRMETVTGGWGPLHTLVVHAPAPGDWYVLAGSSPHYVRAEWDGPVRLEAATDKAVYLPGEPVVISATLTDTIDKVRNELQPPVVWSADVVALVPSASGYQKVPLRGEGGSYSGVWVRSLDELGTTPGHFPILVQASGVGSGGAFSRSLQLGIRVERVAPEARNTPVGSEACDDLGWEIAKAVCRKSDTSYPWRDCNRDGHRGLGPLKRDPYRQELLTDRSLCPLGSPWNPGDGWIYEKP